MYLILIWNKLLYIGAHEYLCMLDKMGGKAQVSRGIIRSHPGRRWVSVRKSSSLFDGAGVVCGTIWNPLLGYWNVTSGQYNSRQVRWSWRKFRGRAWG